MSQIVKRKKKGRPSKADLARRAEEELWEAAEQERVSKRSLHRQNVRYTFDNDEEEDERSREKKLKQLLTLQSCNESGSESVPIGTQRLTHVPAASDWSSGGEYGDRPLKKRKIDGSDEIDEDDEDEEVTRRKPGSREADSVPGAPSDPPLGLPLLEGTSLELILDKLQKKDTYGVYAEPVDLDELPDYHDVIEHPMDFATVRKKLGNGLYSALEQFESDVYLICANAMQYNAPDTIYYKQARSIQELANQKFQELRIDVEQYAKELKSGHKPRSNFSAKQQIKKPLSTTPQEPVGSDFSSGTTLATAGDFQNGSNGKRDGGRERLTNVDGPIVDNTSLVDNKLDKAEDLQGRVPPSRIGMKASTHDENRRATYSISNQPMVGSESIFTTFDGEVKQLVAVGIHADHSYASSLALFAATLGPVAWKFASRRIEEALPPGFNHGRGWVEEYEPFSTPILMLENCSPKEPIFLSKTSSISNPRKDDKTSNNTLSVGKHPISYPNLQGRSSLVSAHVTKPIVSPAECDMVSAKEPLDGKQTFFSSGGTTPTTANVNYQQQSPHYRSNDSGKKVVKQLELNCIPISANQNTWSFVDEKQISDGFDVPASQSMDNVSRSTNLLQSVPLKQPDNCGLVAGGFPNKMLLSNSLVRNRKVVSSSDSIPKQMVMSATYSPHGPEQGLGDPVHLMRMFAENAEKQQKSLNHPPVYNPSVMKRVPSSKRDDSNNASPAASQSWMSIGSGMPKTASENTSAHKYQISTDSLYNNHTRELQQQVSPFRSDIPLSGMQFQPAENSFPLQAFGTPPIRMGNEAHFQNRELNFPPSVADLSRFHMQYPRQGLNPQRLPRQRQESLPPDLNIGVQSSGSPVGQASAVMLDSQHPDLALQL